MYEQLIEKLIKKDVGIIAGNVVDDTEDIVIPVSVVDCAQYLTEADCVAPCHWWGNACHDKPEEEEEFPWWMVIAAVGGAVIVIGLIFAFKGR